MNITPINFNINSYKPSFKALKTIDEFHLPKTTEASPEKEKKASSALTRSRLVLPVAANIQKIGKRKLEEAQKIYFNWQEKRPATEQTKNSYKEYLTSWDGDLNLFIETRQDGSKRTIKYLYGEVVDIVETDADEKTYIYSFEKNSLTKYVKGKHTQIQKRDVITIIPNEYIFTPCGNLFIYREDHRTTKAYNRSQELLGTFTTIGTVMNFNTANNKTRLEQARGGIFMSPSGKRFEEYNFKFDKNGNPV